MNKNNINQSNSQGYGGRIQLWIMGEARITSYCKVCDETELQ